jgi:hypothetical protein
MTAATAMAAVTATAAAIAADLETAALVSAPMQNTFDVIITSKT